VGALGNHRAHQWVYLVNVFNIAIKVVYHCHIMQNEIKRRAIYVFDYIFDYAGFMASDWK
jgi:hypothetical protein